MWSHLCPFQCDFNALLSLSLTRKYADSFPSFSRCENKKKIQFFRVDNRQYIKYCQKLYQHARHRNMQRRKKNAEEFQRLTRPPLAIRVCTSHMGDSIVLICKQPHIAPHHQLTTHIRTLNSIYYSMFHCLSSVSLSVVDTFDAPVIISHCRLRVWHASAQPHIQRSIIFLRIFTRPKIHACTFCRHTRGERKRDGEEIWIGWKMNVTDCCIAKSKSMCGSGWFFRPFLTTSLLHPGAIFPHVIWREIDKVRRREWVKIAGKPIESLALPRHWTRFNIVCLQNG